jgi:hypothetical protein
MTKLLRALATGAAAAVLITWVIAGSARYVRAQDADDTQVTQGPPIAQPAAQPPFPWYGYYDGDIVRHQGSGTGEIDIYDQHGKSVGGSAWLDFPDGLYIQIPVVGTTTAVSFHLHGACHTRMAGRIVGAYNGSYPTLAGTFHVNGCGLKGTGTFEFNWAG